MKKMIKKVGVSLVIMVVTIVIMIILAGTIAITSYSSYDSAKLNMFATEITSIKTGVDNYYLRHDAYPVTDDIEFTVPSGTNDFMYELITDGKVSLKEIDYTKIDVKNLEYGNKKDALDVYALSITTGNVYYLKGFNYDSKTYYTLNDDLAKVLELGDITSLSFNDIKEYDVIFSVSTTKPTNLPVTVIAKVPDNATVNSVTATNSKVVGSETLQNGYKTYRINETGENRNGNYVVTVNYTLNGVTKEAKYSVTNSNNTNPVITYIENYNNGVKTVSVNVTGNIKELKYETDIISDSTYFDNYGKRIKSNTFTIPKDTSYTIYAIDENGNYSLKTVSFWKFKKDVNNKYTLITNGRREIGIGDTINYVATGTDYIEKWCILGANQTGEILIMARENVGKCVLGEADNATKSQHDWQYAEDILDEACASYGSGTGASSITSPRSIRIEDVNKLIGFNPNNTGVYDPDQEGTGNVYVNSANGTYGLEKQFTMGMHFVNNQWVQATAQNPVTIKLTHYTNYPTTLTSSDTGDVVGLNRGVQQEAKIYNMLYRNRNANATAATYYYASKSVNFNPSSSNATYQIRVMYGERTYMYTLLYSTDPIYSLNYGLRPVVALSKDIIITSGTTNDWNIS